MLARTPKSRGTIEPVRCVRRLAPVRTIVSRWRSLTGGARTVVACSGGADSVALLLALRSATQDLVVAHVVHDMRSRSESQGDRDFVEALANDLDAPFASSEIASDKGNAEAASRALRYRALSEIVLQAGSSFVATAHHADDQLETMLLAMTRGAGPRGLSGIAHSRVLCEGVTLVRPMLETHRAETEAICAEAGIQWRHDHTNDDPRRARAALRQNVLPGLRDLRPAAARNASRSAELLRDAAGLLDDRVSEVFGDRTEWKRSLLAAQRPIVIGAGLRRAFLRLSYGRGADKAPKRTIERAISAIYDHRTDIREFNWPCDVVLLVNSHDVQITRDTGGYASDL